MNGRWLDVAGDKARYGNAGHGLITAVSSQHLQLLVNDDSFLKTAGMFEHASPAGIDLGEIMATRF